MKLLLVLGLILLLCSCTPSYTDKGADFPVLPEELKDCKIYSLSGTSGQYLTVVRCPNSTVSTTYRVGKHSDTVVSIN